MVGLAHHTYDVKWEKNCPFEKKWILFGKNTNLLFSPILINVCWVRPVTNVVCTYSDTQHALDHTYAFSYFSKENTFCMQNLVLFNKFSMFSIFLSGNSNLSIIRLNLWLYEGDIISLMLFLKHFNSVCGQPVEWNQKKL